VGTADSKPTGGAPAPSVAYTDVHGRPTDDPAVAVQGEITEYDHQGQLRRTRFFFLNQKQLPWLPVSEAAFLLWVLVGLIAVWLLVGLILGLV
jgi:hypothetical protein